MNDRTRGRTAGAPSTLALILALGLAGAARPSGAVVLHSGDIVMARYVYGANAQILQVDPQTLGFAVISQGPLVTNPRDVAADIQGRILVADHTSGIVVVDAASGGESVLASSGSLGGTPSGICVASDGQLFVSVNGPTPGVVRLSADGSSVTPVTNGDRISAPGGLAIGPDGALYVTEANLPADNGSVYGYPGHGSIVRVDLATGSQSVAAADPLFLGPWDIVFVGPDEVWTMQIGSVAGRQGCFISTQLSSGHSQQTGTYQCRSSGMVQTLDGAMVVSDCNTIGPDCFIPFTTRLPGGPTVNYLSGTMAVVPFGVTPVHRSSWGTLKTIYR
jgi:sugar lactone lactonase YvrE